VIIFLNNIDGIVFCYGGSYELALKEDLHFYVIFTLISGFKEQATFVVAKKLRL
jgi:hypothetical protein